MQIHGVNNPLEAAKWGKTPIIQKKAVEASKNAMTDDFVKKLQELARRDAQKGGGMSQEAIDLCHAQMNKYVSPDRSAPIAQMTQELQKAEKAHKGEDPTLEFLDRMLAQLKGKGRPERIVKSFSGWLAAVLVIFIVPPKTRLLRYIRPMGKKSRNIIQAVAVG